MNKKSNYLLFTALITLIISCSNPVNPQETLTESTDTRIITEESNRLFSNGFTGFHYTSMAHYAYTNVRYGVLQDKNTGLYKSFVSMDNYITTTDSFDPDKDWVRDTSFGFEYAKVNFKNKAGFVMNFNETDIPSKYSKGSFSPVTLYSNEYSSYDQAKLTHLYVDFRESVNWRVHSETIIREPDPVPAPDTTTKPSKQIPITPTTAISQNSSLIRSYNPGTVSDRHVLSLYARLDYDYLAGASTTMKIRVNGHTIIKTDLINKPMVANYPDSSYKYKYIYANGSTYHSWFNDSEKTWSVFYAPNLTKNNLANSRYNVIGGEATKYEFDITPYLTPDINNIIEIVHTGKAAVSLRVADVEIWKKISSAADATLNRGEKQTMTIPVTDSSKTYIVKLYSRLLFNKLAGFNHSMAVNFNNSSLDKTAILNKPMVANYYDEKHKYEYVTDDNIIYMNGRQLFLNSLFVVPYSANFNANNLASSHYRVIGGEAYKWVFKMPQESLITGSNTFYVKNENSHNYKMNVIGTEAFEITSLIP